MQPRRRTWKRKQPIAVTIVAWGIVVLFLIRLYQVIEPLWRLRILEDGIPSPLIIGMQPTAVGRALFSSTGYLLLSLIGIAVLIGFLRLHRWAWVVLMSWTGASLAITLINYFYGQPNYLVMISNVIIALALNQTDVLRIFQIRTDSNGHSS